MGSAASETGRTVPRWDEPGVLRALLEATPTVVAIIDSEGRLEYANGRFERLTGRSLEGMAGADWFEMFIPERDRAQARARFTADMAGGTAPESRDAIAAEDGREHLIAWQHRILRDPGGGTAMLLVGLDVTAENEREDQHYRQEQMLMAVSDSIVVTDLTGRITDWSPGATALYGFSADEMIGKPIRSLYRPEEWERRNAEVVAPLSARGEHRVEVRVLHKSGREIDIALRLALLHDRHGEPSRIVGYSTDITEQKATARALAESESLFRTITDLSPAGVYRMSLVNKPSYVNDRWCEITGRSLDDVTGSGLAAVVHPDDLERVRAAWSAASDDAPFAADFRVVRPNGDVVWVFSHARPEKAADGTVVGYVGSMVDTTERRAVREAAFRTERRLAEAVRVTNIGIFEHDHVADTVYWSPEQYAIFGVSEEAATDLAQFYEFLHPDDREATAAAVLRAHDPAGDGRFDLQYRIVRADGDVRWLSTRSQTIFEGEGDARRAVRTVGAVHDITERKRAEAELLAAQELQERLELELAEAKRMEAIGTLASGIAHDFNNILSSILGNSELALEDLPPDSEAHKAIESARQSARHGAKLVRQILTFSRQEHEPRQVIEPAEVVREAVRLSRASLPAEVELTLDLAPELPNVVANETQVHQIVVNLCTNARHAIGDRPGHIWVDLAEITFGPHSPEIGGDLQPGRYVHLSVTDNGSGIDPAIRDRIFDPFFTTKPVSHGTGLGLSVVHGIVKSHGGAISVKSEPTTGTRFDVYLPATDEPAVAVDRPGHDAPANGGGGRILFVDDEPALSSLGQRALERAGYTVTAFTDPLSALGKVREDVSRFDLAMIDFNMPGVSGLDIARELHELRPDLPVVLMSGYVTEELQAKSALLGVRSILQKPMTIGDLARVADELVRG